MCVRVCMHTHLQVYTYIHKYCYLLWSGLPKSYHLWKWKKSAGGEFFHLFSILHNLASSNWGGEWGTCTFTNSPAYVNMALTARWQHLSAWLQPQSTNSAPQWWYLLHLTTPSIYKHQHPILVTPSDIHYNFSCIATLHNPKCPHQYVQIFSHLQESVGCNYCT
jgi:hypothetical protein